LAGETLFIDTSYVYAFISPRDQWHGKAVEWQERVVSENRSLITTEFVLAEIADGLSAINYRQAALGVIRILQNNPFVRLIPASSDLFQQALTLYEQRQDKDWGLTDCASFVVMSQHHISDALTADDHFRQAGYKALLLD
jgi:predicted nucleic acid-binding protein